MKKLTTEEFIENCKEKYGDRFDLTNVIYTNNKSKILIKCNIHGLFEIRADHFIFNKSEGCQKCSQQSNTKDFIEKAKKIHNNYNYSLVDYKNSTTKIKIICSIHGMFEQTPNTHLRGSGCQKCSIIRTSYEIENQKKIFIQKSNKFHNNKYDYSLVNYFGNKNVVNIICPIHGIFEQRPDSHLRCGCNKCGIDNMKYTISEFVENSNNIHKNKYDYSLVDYMDNKTKVKIKCKQHGFFLQTPQSHRRGQGCPVCNESKGERIISTILNNKNIKYIKQYKFDECINKRKLPFDFYLQELNMCIEFDGKQHFEKVSHWSGEEGLKNTKRNDKIKTTYCLNNNIKLIRIKYNENIENILSQIEKDYFENNN